MLVFSIDLLDVFYHLRRSQPTLGVRGFCQGYMLHRHRQRAGYAEKNTCGPKHHDVGQIGPYTGRRDELGGVGQAQQDEILAVSPIRLALAIKQIFIRRIQNKSSPLGVTSQISKSLELSTEALDPPELVAPVAAVPRCSAAHRTAACRPFGTSTANQITRLAQAQRRNKNGKPSQLFPDLLMITWITFGPIIDDAVFDSP